MEWSEEGFVSAQQAPSEVPQEFHFDWGQPLTQQATPDGLDDYDIPPKKGPDVVNLNDALIFDFSTIQLGQGQPLPHDNDNGEDPFNRNSPQNIEVEESSRDPPMSGLSCQQGQETTPIIIDDCHVPVPAPVDSSGGLNFDEPLVTSPHPGLGLPLHDAMLDDLFGPSGKPSLESRQERVEKYLDTNPIWNFGAADSPVDAEPVLQSPAEQKSQRSADFFDSFEMMPSNNNPYGTAVSDGHPMEATPEYHVSTDWPQENKRNTQTGINEDAQAGINEDDDRHSQRSKSSTGSTGTPVVRPLGQIAEAAKKVSDNSLYLLTVLRKMKEAHRKTNEDIDEVLLSNVRCSGGLAVVGSSTLEDTSEYIGLKRSEFLAAYLSELSASIKLIKPVAVEDRIKCFIETERQLSRRGYTVTREQFFPIKDDVLAACPRLMEFLNVLKDNPSDSYPPSLECILEDSVL